jgi:hypothetical protein
MRHIQFIGSWTGTGASILDAQRPMAADLWRANGVAFEQLRDMGQPNVRPEPNVCVWEAIVEDKGVTLLEQDAANYTILLDEEIKQAGILATKPDGAKTDKARDTKPDATEKTAVETFLKTKGVKASDAVSVSKKSESAATRQDIANAVITYCNALPKKK